MRLKVNKIHSLSVLIFIIVFLFSWWSHPSLIPKTSPDAYEYLNLAKNPQDLKSGIGVGIRPIFFPIIIKTSMLLSDLYWKQIFSIIQISLHAFICLLLYNLYIKIGLRNITAFFITLMIGFNPSLVYYTTYILADHLLAVLTTLSWISMIKSFLIYKENQKINIYLIISAIFSGLAVITKPVALLAIIPLLLTLIYISNKSKKLINVVVIMLLIHFSFHITWEKYKIYNNPKFSFEIFDHIALGINMAALRGGLVDYGKGTELFNEIKEKKLLSSARDLDISISYTSDLDTNYWKIHKTITWERKNDKTFAKQIINQAPLHLLLIQMSNWHSFFTKRSFSPGEGSFPYLPNTIRKLYLVFYSLLYRPFLICLLILSFFILWKKKLHGILISSIGIILYASFSIGMITPHSGEFPRYRVWVEYIMFFCALVPIGLIIENLSNRFYTSSNRLSK